MSENKRALAAAKRVLPILMDLRSAVAEVAQENMGVFGVLAAQLVSAESPASLVSLAAFCLVAEEKGPDLWVAFTAVRDAKPEGSYVFGDYIAEVVAASGFPVEAVIEVLNL